MGTTIGCRRRSVFQPGYASTRINVDKPIKRRPSENQLVSRKTREISCHLLSRKICMKLFCLFGLMTTVYWEKYWL